MTFATFHGVLRPVRYIHVLFGDWTQGINLINGAQDAKIPITFFFLGIHRSKPLRIFRRYA